VRTAQHALIPAGQDLRLLSVARTYPIVGLRPINSVDGLATMALSEYEQHLIDDLEVELSEMIPNELRWLYIARSPAGRLVRLVAAIGIYIAALQVPGGLGMALAIISYLFIAVVIISVLPHS
jgi:hypothetical protein